MFVQKTVNKKAELFDLRVVLHAETEKAWKVSPDGRKENAVWLPKSQCEYFPSPGAMSQGTITMPAWLAEEKELA